jgi:hypothetical protein
VLTFTKSAYRLGESVLGIVDLNGRNGRARVLKVCTELFVVSIALLKSDCTYNSYLRS